MKSIVRLVVVILLPLVVASGQDTLVYREEAERLFVDALRHVEAEDHAVAAEVFQRLIVEFPESHRITASYLMLGKSRYRMGKLHESIQTLTEFLSKHPASAYVADARFMLGLNYLRLHRTVDAATEFLSAAELTRNERLAQRSETMLNRLARASLSRVQLQPLVLQARSPQMRSLLSVRLAERTFGEGDARTAQELLWSVLASSPRSPYADEARELLDRIQQGGVLKVAAMLPPISSAEQGSRSAGLEFWRGLQLAVDEHNAARLPKIVLETHEINRNGFGAGQVAERITRESDVVAIVGPVYSDEAFAAADVANVRGVPMLTPTATANGITDGKPYVFQLNPDYEVRGRVMAYFAREHLRAKRFAVLAPTDEIGRLMAEAFIDEVREHDGDVVDVQWFESGTTDLRPQLMAIRLKAIDRREQTMVDFSRKLLRPRDVARMLDWGVPQRLLDSLSQRESLVSVNVLFGEGGKYVADSLELTTVGANLKPDSLAIPVQNIDAIFAPITNADEVGVVSSQLRYFNFQAQVLGSGEWNDLVELDRNRQYTGGVYFPSDNEVDDSSPEYRSFADRFLRAYASRPTPGSLFAYDTMKLLLEVIGGGAVRRAEIAAALSTVRNYPGLHSKVSFNAERVNGHLMMMQFKDRTIRRVCEVDLANRQILMVEDR
jgi:ABC-type branched-subunit amino acid transport system substrate-binding protein